MAGMILWSVYPFAYSGWRLTTVVIGLLWFSGPLVAFAISAGALILDQPASRLMKRAVTVHFGVSLIVGLAVLIADYFSRAVGMFILLAALIDLPILVLTPGRVDNPRVAKLLHTSIVLSVAGSIGGLFLWSALNIKIVEWRALAVADAYPYCLQVPADHIGRHKKVTRAAELTGLRMQVPFTRAGASGDRQFAFHSVLVVRNGGRNEFYNWSYFAQSFVPVSVNAVKGLHLNAACEPIIAFFDTLK